MKRIIVAILLLQVALSDYACAIDFSPYVGKDLNEEVGGRTLLEVPEVKSNLIKSFGLARYNQLAEAGRGRGTVSINHPLLGQLFVTSSCRMGGCAYTSVIIMRANGDMLGLCLASPIDGTTTASVEWSGVEWSGLPWNKKYIANDFTNACYKGPPEAEVAEFLTTNEWFLYTDRYSLIHSVPVKDGEPSTGNSLLTTAEACVVMQFTKIGMDKAHFSKMLQGLELSQVKPGLFKRGPTKNGPDDYSAHDDYWGLGALDTICGFNGIARKILDYGRGSDQSSGSTVLEKDSTSFAPIADKLKQCTTIPYNYNNVHPGLFENRTWFGRYPALITHLKGAAKEKIGADELGVWAASLIIDSRIGDDPGRWLVSWIQVITYQMSERHSSAADFAVTEWWKSLRKVYPGGMKQVMRKDLNTEADTHPLGKYIDDFDNFRNPKPIMVDTSSDIERVLGPIASILSHDCEPTDRASCIRYNDFSPTNSLLPFLTPFKLALSTSSVAVEQFSKELAEKVNIIEHQVEFVQIANDKVDALSTRVGELTASQSGLSRQLSDANAKMTDRLNRGTDKLPGHWVRGPDICPPELCLPHTHICKRPPCAPGPNVWVPEAIDPEFQRVRDQVDDLKRKVEDAGKQLAQKEQELQAAEQDLKNKKSLDWLKGERDRIQGVLAKAKGANDTARGALQWATAFVENLIPCSDNFLRH